MAPSSDRSVGQTEGDEAIRREVVLIERSVKCELTTRVVTMPAVVEGDDYEETAYLGYHAALARRNARESYFCTDAVSSFHSLICRGISTMPTLRKST